MLSKNFQVCRQILKNPLPILRFSKKVSQNGKFIEWSQKEIYFTPEENRKNLEPCPKSSLAQICRETFFAKSKPRVNRKLFHFTLHLIRSLSNFSNKILNKIDFFNKIMRGRLSTNFEI